MENSWITSGVLQGSILGPLHFNIFVNDIFLFAKNSTLCNYVMTIPSVLVKKAFGQVINNLQSHFRTFKVWFYVNFLVLNPKKYPFLTFGNGNNLRNFACDEFSH